MLEIFEKIVHQLRENAEEHFGNGRVIRNLVEHIQQEQANRLAVLPYVAREHLIMIEEDDVLMAIENSASKHGGVDRL